MGGTIKVSQSVDETTPSGAMPTITAASAAGVAYAVKAFLDGAIPVGGSKVFTPPAGFTSKALVLRIFSEEAGDRSDDFNVLIVTSLPQTITLHPTPNDDGSIMLTIPATFGPATAPEFLTSVTISDVDALHADATNFTIEAAA